MAARLVAAVLVLAPLLAARFGVSGPRVVTLNFGPGDAVWSSPDDALVRRCFDALVESGLTTADRLEGGFVRRFRNFYPMYTIDYRERLGRVYDRVRTPADNLVPTGRLGMFNYNNSDHCLDMGRFIASEMGEGRPPRQIWAGLEERVRTYRIID